MERATRLPTENTAFSLDICAGGDKNHPQRCG
jgi:hypothetical protein